MLAGLLTGAIAARSPAEAIAVFASSVFSFAGVSGLVFSSIVPEHLFGSLAALDSARIERG